MKAKSSNSGLIQTNHTLVILTVIILIGIGFIAMELIKQFSNQAATQQALSQSQLEQDAPKLISQAINKVLESPSLSITNKKTEDVYGCEFGYTYSGEYTEKLQYAKIEPFHNNNALIKESCTSETTSRLDYLQGEAYWQSDQKYYRTSSMFSFEKDTGYSLVAEPKEYMSKYFSAYNFSYQIQSVFKRANEDDVKIDLSVDSNNIKYVYKLEINYPTQTITSLKIYEADNTLNTRKEEIELAYTTPNIQNRINRAQLDVDRIVQLLEDPETDYTLASRVLRITKSADDSSLTQYLIGSSAQDSNIEKCKLQVRSCANKLLEFNTEIAGLISNFSNTPPTLCTDQESSAKPKPMMADAELLSLSFNEYAMSNRVPKLKLDIDLKSGEAQLTTDNNNCYNNKLAVETVNSSYEKIKALALQ